MCLTSFLWFKHSSHSYYQDHYEAFMRMVREWRHLKMLKRAGRGYNLAGVEGTGRGECAVICPACPQPGKNLLDDWRDAPKGKRYERLHPSLYSLG
jgi:hypothetical protein